MPLTPLQRSFFEAPTLEVAQDLLGCLLVRRLDSGELLVARIVDLEAYIGEEDTACHASRGRTPRTEVMYGPAGHAYVYLIYGLHELLNLVTEPQGRPCGIMLRGLEPYDNEAGMRRLRQAKGRQLSNGPGKLTKALAVTRELNGLDLTLGQDLWVAARPPGATFQVEQGPRIGIDYAAEKDRLAPWRFWIADNPWVGR
ncbi:DNA-3-methyladenine glycosylase [Marinospirillum perlucidum]|uniref:DNA-3-methyladenine glycosylase n=1 Tax=Marinospirillum perlucidum TaxID=1982602 RepID=UPI000DF36128|nr:DNA-3-methyladenine glycosylase [Marinospirillum perlucidum]